jgi:hypothetical protein
MRQKLKFRSWTIGLGVSAALCAWLLIEARLTADASEPAAAKAAENAEKTANSAETAKRAASPAVKNEAWVRDDLDRFVLARLEREGLTPSPPTDKHTLIRRVTLDLTGLGPTIEEIDAFVHDESPDAYEKLVDRLLASPHFGERMAADWLDLARYSDTYGSACCRITPGPRPHPRSNSHRPSRRSSLRNCARVSSMPNECCAKPV